jgi:hypothetical protein
VVASNWWILLAVNGVLPLLWLLLGRTPHAPASFWGRIVHPIVFLNRQVGHIELVLSTMDRLKMAVETTAAPDEEEIVADQKHRARSLFACLASQPDCGVAEDLASLDDEAYTNFLKRVAATPEGEKALACLAWAASDMQAHKATGTQISDALRCAFADPSMPGPAEYVASLEAFPCR